MTIAGSSLVRATLIGRLAGGPWQEEVSASHQPLGVADTVVFVPPGAAAAEPDISVVLLTMGDRRAELTDAIGSATSQRGIDVEIVVVANGVAATEIGVPPGSGTVLVELPENRGIPGGRNVGAVAATAPLIAFLDDDARYVDTDVLARTRTMFRENAQLGAVALRLVDENGTTARRHIPRIGARDADRSGPVTAFLGGAAVIRRAAFDGAGCYPEEFVYAMEETDLALRMVDRGWEIHYDGHPAVYHPASEPTRHSGAAERTMRNRVWLAHRNLPAPIAVAYVLNWLTASIIRRPADARHLLRSTINGWRTRPGPRAPIAWRTVWHLVRLGRPPLI